MIENLLSKYLRIFVEFEKYLFHHRDRIMVTLSCLIVVASLFSQTTSSMPASASPKVMDIFFLYYIIQLFFICLHHSIVYFKIQREEKIKSRQISKTDWAVIDRVFQYVGTLYDFIFKCFHCFSKSQSGEEALVSQFFNTKAARWGQDNLPNVSLDQHVLQLIMKFNFLFRTVLQIIDGLCFIVLTVFILYRRKCVQLEYNNIQMWFVTILYKWILAWTGEQYFLEDNKSPSSLGSTPSSP